MPHVSPQLIGLDVADLAGIDLGQRLTCDFLADPIHHRVVTDTHKPFSGALPYALGIVPQRTFFDLGQDLAAIKFAEGGAAAFAAVALMAVTAAPVFDPLIA